MRLRLFLYFTVVVLVTILSMLSLATFGLAREVRSYMFHGGMYRTTGLVEQLQAFYAANGSWQGVQEVINLQMPNRERGGIGPGQRMGTMMRQRLILTDSEGLIVADSATSIPSGKVDEQFLARGLPISVGGRIVGILISESGMTFSVSDEIFLVGRLRRSALIAGLIAAGISLILAFYLAYRILRPVQALTQAAQLLGSGDLTQRAQIHGDDELAELGRTFNSMASSLESTEQSRKAMTADIAHELRNPLSVQRAHLEAMQDGVFPVTAENLQPILEQNLLLTRLVEDLNTLALVDSGQLVLQRSLTDFTELVQRVMERFRPQAIANQINLDLNPNQANLPPLSIDSLRVEQIIGNLLSNAFRYTPENGRIELSVVADRKSLRLAVHDSGEGIPPDVLPHIFERFYRADRSRSRSMGGSGLGLAIARKLAEAHGGSLGAENHPSGGAVFSLTLPGSPGTTSKRGV